MAACVAGVCLSMYRTSPVRVASQRQHSSEFPDWCHLVLGDFSHSSQDCCHSLAMKKEFPFLVKGEVC